MNEDEMHSPGHSAELGDAELDAKLAAAEGRLLTAIEYSLDLDAGLARIIGDPSRHETAPVIASSAENTPEPEGPRRAIPEAAERTIETITEQGEPDPARGRPALQTQADTALHAHATATITRLLKEHPGVAKEIKETLRTRVYLRELAERTNRFEYIEADTEQHAANLAVKLDPGDRRRLSFGLGLAIAVALVILDAIPLNWAAQAFGFTSAGTWLVTFILVAASTAAMFGMEFTRGHPRRRGVLAATITAGYLALLGLRTEFLITVSNESLPVALLQSALLTAISAGLVLCGSAVLARTRHLSHSRARAAARRAAQAADAGRAAQQQAAEKLQRHIGSLHHMLLPWALRSAAPEGVDRAKWDAALNQAIRALFSAVT